MTAQFPGEQKDTTGTSDAVTKLQDTNNLPDVTEGHERWTQDTGDTQGHMRTHTMGDTQGHIRLRDIHDTGTIEGHKIQVTHRDTHGTVGQLRDTR